jgi:beta-lactamase regulating signal transducer with metallopeptidase domain
MTTSHDLINVVAHTTVEILLNSLWQGIILTALSWLVLRGMRRANAATRYGFLCATLLALIALPIFNGLSPLRAKTQQQASSPFTLEKSGPSSEALPVSFQMVRSKEKSVVAVAMAQHESVAAENNLDGESKTSRKVAGEEKGIGASTAAQPRRWSQEIQLPDGSWLLPLFVAWLLIAAVRVGRVGQSLLRLWQLKHRSLPLAPEYELRLRRLAGDCRIKRKVRLGSLTDISVPMVIGLLRPVILFPQKLVEELTGDEFEMILLHELGHVRRWDDWTNMGQKLVEAVFFFHPAILWVGRHLNLEREIACDDHVISVTQESRTYAVCLARLAELTLMPRRASLAPGALFSKKQIVSRVELLLKRKRNAKPQLSKLGLLAPLGILLAAIIQCLVLSPVIAVSKKAGENVRRKMAFAQAPVEIETGRNSSLSAYSPNYSNDGETLRAGAQSVSADFNGQQNSRQPSTTDEASRSTTFFGPNPANNGTVQESGDFHPAASPTESRKGGQGVSLAASVAKLPSSWDKAEALIAVLGQKSSLDSVPDDFFEVVKTIPSPMDQTRVLSALLAKRLSKGLLTQTLKAITSVGTESDKRELLIRAARICPNDDAVLNVYLQVVAVENSPSDQDSALSALLERSDLSRDILLRTKALALRKIASTQSQQHVVEKVNSRLAERDRG